MNAHKDGLIDHPIISISNFDEMIAIGGLIECNNWTKHDVQAPWTLKTKTIEILNQKYEGAIIVG
jgi:hypothetical protein